jgi:hypothetical protein
MPRRETKSAGAKKKLGTLVAAASPEGVGEDREFWLGEARTTISAAHNDFSSSPRTMSFARSTPPGRLEIIQVVNNVNNWVLS